MRKTTLSIVLALFAVAVPALAQATTPDGSQIVARVQNTLQQAGVFDNVVANDGALFSQNNIAGRFHIAFQPYIRVCDVASAGNAACNSRVIADGRGIPRVHRIMPKVLPPGYGPAQFLGGYALTGIASTTARPVIAIVDAYDDPYIQSDLNTYSTTYGIATLPACSGPIHSSSVACFQKVNQNGSTVNHPRSNSGWALEISLDVEVAHALCQNCSILLVEATSNSYSNLMAAEDRAVALGATVVSNSWGSSEFSGESGYDSHFDHPGVAFTVSAGDSGYGVQYPAASPYVTAVGGTSLYLNRDNSYNTEIAWSGTGSGCSSFEGKPAWQSDPGCAKRTVADVSADADPNTGAAVYDSLSYYGYHGWYQVGGTSLASPIIAAVYALSGNVSGSANDIPYALAPAGLHDITSGSNGSCGGSYLCTAQSGFDGPTGLGSPNGSAAF